MNKLLALPLVAFAVACVQSEPVELSADEQSELSQVLRGRTAGATLSCVPQRNLRNSRSVGEGVILFDGPNNVIYVNRPSAGCPELTRSRALVTRTPSTQLCRGDISTVVEPATNFQFGGCTLGEFTPYRRAD